MSTTGSAAAAALARLGGLLPVDPSSLSDLQLIALVEHAEDAGRQVEAVQLAAAREVARRSDACVPDSLARRLGFRTPAQAIEAITKASASEARKLVTDAEALAKLPAVEAAVLDGRIGRDAAAAIAGELKKVAADAAAKPDGAGSLDTAQLVAVEEHLVELATTTTADEVRTRAHQIAAELTPEMVRTQAEKAMAQRYFRISATKGGAARVFGLVPAGHAAVMRSAIDAYLNPRAQKTVAFVDAETGLPAGPGSSSADAHGADGGRAGAAADPRSIGQKTADLVRDIFATQARAADAPDMGGDHPTVWVTTTTAELEAGEGLAFYAGTDEAVPVTEAAQAACAGGTQLVIFGDDGRLLNLGREVRGFTRRQRRAIATRDGGTCLIPGCTIPAQWCEVHHVVAYRDGGKTDADNGVLLCWFHHREIDSGPWQIRMRGGTPEVRYAFGHNVRDWAPAGNGAATRIRASARAGTIAAAAAERSPD